MRSSYHTFVTRGVVLLLIALSIVFVGPEIKAQAYTPSPTTVAAYEARVAWRINKMRYLYGEGYVRPSTCPDYYAERWSAYLARTRLFYHSSLTPMLVGCRAAVGGEILARGNISADGLVYAWMASPSHRYVILDRRFNRIGVGATYAYGQWTVATEFTQS